VGFLSFAAPICGPAAPAVQTVAELVAAVEDGKDGDTLSIILLNDCANILVH
jgi:hypothetical protein